MLDRYQPVAWMISGAEHSVPRQRMLELQQLADLRLVDDRPSFMARAVERVRAILAPAPTARPEPVCCPA